MESLRQGHRRSIDIEDRSQMSEYDEMPQVEQIAMLEEFAHDLLVQYGIRAKSIACINHSSNTIFKLLTTENQTYAMRISTNSRKWPEHIWAETQWLREIARAGSVIAPNPILNLQGELYSNHYFFYQGGNLDVIIYPWLEGDVVLGRPTDDQLFQLGAAMARLHQQSRNWEPEGYANFMDVDRPLMVRRDNLFSVAQNQISPELYTLLEELNLRSATLFDTLKERFERQLIHADLHFRNVLWHENKISILDFDDAGIGSPLQDLAISIFSLRKDPHAEQHLFAGYASVTPIPEHEPWEMELLIANRQLVLLNLLFETTVADEIALIPEYLVKVEKRLRHFLETGEFVRLE